MILAPIGPVILWIIIIVQVLAGSAMMKFIRNLGTLKYILAVAAVCAVAAIPYRFPIFRYKDYVTRLALYTGDLHMVDMQKNVFEFGPRLIGSVPLFGVWGKTTDDEFSAKIYNVPSRHTLYFLQMARLEAARVRLGGKPIFHERPSSHSAVPNRIPLAVKPGTEPEWEVVDNDGKYIGEGTWLID